MFKEYPGCDLFFKKQDSEAHTTTAYVNKIHGSDLRNMLLLTDHWVKYKPDTLAFNVPFNNELVLINGKKSIVDVTKVRLTTLSLQISNGKTQVIWLKSIYFKI